MRSRPIQTSSSASTWSTSTSIFPLLLQHAQPPSSNSQTLPSSLFDIPPPLRPSSAIETSFTNHTYPRPTHSIGSQESVSSLSAFITADLTYHTKRENSRPPTPDPYHYPLKFDNQRFNLPRQDLKYHILPLKRIIKSLQYFNITRNRGLTRLPHTTTELQFEVTVKVSA